MSESKKDQDSKVAKFLALVETFARGGYDEKSIDSIEIGRSQAQEKRKRIQIFY